MVNSTADFQGRPVVHVMDREHRPVTPLVVDVVRLSQVERRAVEWLWPGRIALGKLTLLVGEPGVGKSFLTLDLAARVSRGWGMGGEKKKAEGGGGKVEGGEQIVEKPEEKAEYIRAAGEGQPGSVVVLSAEDDLADTVRPRLEAHGADCERVVAIRAIGEWTARGKLRREFDLSQDIAHLETVIGRLDNCRLVVVDPISAYLGERAENVNSEVRKLLAPLAELASRRRLAVVLVTHLRKNDDGAAVERTIGSIAFVAAARSAWVVCRDPRKAVRRLLLPLKNNMLSEVSGLAFTIEARGEGGAAVVCWSDEVVTRSTDEVLAERPGWIDRSGQERRDAVEWLREFLATGPQEARAVRSAAEAHGIGYATLRRAFREAGGVAVREGAGVPARWRWQLKVAEAAEEIRSNWRGDEANGNGAEMPSPPGPKDC
ncbi:MAG: AAA family ATPase [Pirellulales bacterium]